MRAAGALWGLWAWTRYKTLHDDIMKRRRPKRLLVYKPGGQLCNILRGTLAAFLFALMTDRALVRHRRCPVLSSARCTTSHTTRHPSLPAQSRCCLQGFRADGSARSRAHRCWRTIGSGTPRHTAPAIVPQSRFRTVVQCCVARRARGIHGAQRRESCVCGGRGSVVC